MRDESKEVALFQELSSCPATMQASKAADAWGLLDGHKTQQADAVQAYTQSKLGGLDTWVALPKEAWPPEWHSLPYHDPVCPLILALYGHPDSGGFWEKHCDKHLKKVGFKPMPSWRSCYYHKDLDLFLIVYVDDFKMLSLIHI